MEIRIGRGRFSCAAAGAASTHIASSPRRPLLTALSGHERLGDRLQGSWPVPADSLYNTWIKTTGTNVYTMMTNGTPENVQRQIVDLLPRLRRFARNLTRNPHDADDVVQIAVERALARLSQWRSDSPLDRWMYKIVKNAWFDEIRSRKRRDEVFLPADAGDAATGDDPGDALSIRAAMERLPDEQRLAISLVLVEGLSYQEAADVLDVPVGTLTSRLARGRQALQAALRP